jgi:hypothetical protein
MGQENWLTGYLILKLKVMVFLGDILVVFAANYTQDLTVEFIQKLLVRDTIGK